MPCNDVTEVLRLILDKEDRVIEYGLHKKTCGGSVGDPSLLGFWARGRLSTEIMDASPEDFLQKYPTDDIIQEFLRLKHFFALQNGLKVLFGLESGSLQASCIVDKIVYTSEGIEFTAQVKVRVLTRQIKACGSCMSCGTKNILLARKLQSSSLL
ncbi:hypothetical protein HYV57_02420 [Candidatus Peregrinibacteria bacterium]|nr:hypothetical protein [Candidatus Peregrinibacteria bacterium]MBI4234867.1 hypothetical protein [Candidatus Peregrinibacteria bacterium]